MKYVVVTILLLLLVAACAPTESDDGPIVETGGDIEVATGDDTPAGDDAQADLEKIFKGASDEFQVTYDFSMTGDGESFSGSMAMYLKGERMRQDSTQSIDGETHESRIFIAEDEFIMCTRDGGWQCMRLEAPETEESALDFQESFEENEEEFWNEYSVYAAPSRRIAGVTAQCFKMSFAAGGESVSDEICYSKEGVPLYLEIKSSDGTMKQEATSYSASVSNSVFTPPAEPQDMNAMMEQVMGQYGADFDLSDYE